MTSAEIRARFLKFFEERGHTVVPSSSLVPDDPSVLLTTAGMQQFKPYYTELDPLTTVHPSIGRPIGKNAVSCQKSFRTSDIDEVGDERHFTFFEMLGNFSFGGYFKKEAISWAHEFITKEMGLTISFVSVFEGKDDIGVPKDTESRDIWKALGVADIREQGMDDVFWGPTGASGPCGPTTEIYVRNAAGQDIEIWNIVFNQFFYPGSREELLLGAAGKELRPLPTPGVDTGMGLERLAMVKQGKASAYETDLFVPLMGVMAHAVADERLRRILADHARAAAFLIADGVRPSNKEQGYVLRRLLRRMIVHVHLRSTREADAKTPLTVGHETHIQTLLSEVVEHYGDIYPNLDEAAIRSVYEREYAKFVQSLVRGLKEMKRLEAIDAPAAFKLYESHGLPYEVIKELGEKKTEGLRREDFDAEFRRHQDTSRAGQEKKFGGHGLLLDTGELKARDETELKKVTRLHTATHMLQQALRDVLGPEVKQMGSDITVERTRFDFAFPRKLTPEELRAVEARVNEKTKEDLPMQKAVMPKAEAEKTGALYFFKEKYPDPVNVYFVGRDMQSAWSKEFCGGPHVTHTGEVGTFRIAKEEAVGAGTRRIRGVVDP